MATDPKPAAAAAAAPKARGELRMRSPDPDVPIHLALTSGHTFVIGKEFVAVPKMFRSMAIARGALLEGQEPEEEVKVKKPPTKHDTILDGVRRMVEDGGQDDFTSDGKPKADKLSALVGFTVTADERDEAYRQVEAELGKAS